MDLVGDEELSSHADQVFEVLYLMSITCLSNTFYQVGMKHRENIYIEKRLNLIITKDEDNLWRAQR